MGLNYYIKYLSVILWYTELTINLLIVHSKGGAAMPHSAHCQVWEILHPPLGAAVPRHSGHCKESTRQQHEISIRYGTCFTVNKIGEDTQYYSVLH